MYVSFTIKLWSPPRAIAKLLLIMRLTTLLLITAIMQVSASSYAQKISLSERNASLTTVLDRIRVQTGYDFLFESVNLKSLKSISVKASNEDLNLVLDRILKPQNLDYTIKDKAVVIKTREASLLDKAKSALDHVIGSSLVIQSAVKDLDVKGRVVDQDGKPLPNASIRIKGKNTVTNTNADGEFEIKGVDEDAVLLVSYVGFKTLEIPLKDAVMPLEIKLNVQTGKLEEVKVVYNTGYQEINKERATGSFVHIDNELFNRRVGANVLDRIVDLVPGLLAKRNLDAYSSALDGISIRGTSTINASKRPLLVIDNFVYEGSPNNLNPNDIESITVLKDAAASSIWGARAGNGVIVVTTKKGRKNSIPNVSFNSNLTIGEKPDLFSIPVVSSLDVITLERKRFAEGYYNSLLGNTFTYPALSQVVEILARQRTGAISMQEANAQIAKYEQHDIRSDISRFLLQTAMAQQYALSISGGANDYRYYGSIGYDRGRPNDINIHRDRLTIGFNNTWTPLKKLEINAQMNWGQSIDQNKNSLSGSGGYKDVLSNPYNRLVDENKDILPLPRGHRMIYADTVNFPGKLDWRFYPLYEAQNGNRLEKGYNTRINGSFNYTIVQGLKVEAGYNWQKSTVDNTNIQGINTFFTRDLVNQFTQKNANGQPVYPYPLGGIYSQNNNDQTSWTFRSKLNFNRSFKGHEINSILGVERSEAKSKTLIPSTQYGYNSETNVFGLVQSGDWVTRPGGSIGTIGATTSQLNGTLNRFGSYYGNVGYTYNQKYTLTTSGRIDESNFFGVEANDRKKPLWSIGLKWDISEEKFYKLNFLPQLSLRATYGYAGNVNAGISPFATVSYANPSSITFLPSARIETPPNPELTWENVRIINFALDFRTSNQDVTGSLDFYHKKATDLISDITADATSGFIQYTGNSSSVQTKGLDFALKTRNISGIFKWDSSLNFAIQKDEIISYTVEPPNFARTSGIFIGKPLSSIYSLKWAGLNPLNGDAQMYVDGQVVGSAGNYLTKAGQRNMLYSGQSSPPVFGSFRNDFSFKNITLSLNITYQLGYYFRRGTFDGLIGLGTASNNSTWDHEDYLRTWKMPGDELITNVPGFLNTYSDNRYSVYQNSDILIEKGDHIRLQDIRLDYNINKTNLKHLPFKDVRFYGYINNVGIIWKASKYSPDTQNTLFVTIPKTFALGINVNF